MNYYISDLHFGHRNAIEFDKRPFSTVEEMDDKLITRWNRKVKDADQVYIIGDFFCRNEKPEEWYLEQLNGKKHLIIGNHDMRLLENPVAMKHFESVDKMMHVTDEGKQICLCHFPIAEWNGFYKKSWHIYGHIHGAKTPTYEYMRNKERALNAAACINNYEPSSFQELVRHNKLFREERYGYDKM